MSSTCTAMCAIHEKHPPALTATSPCAQLLVTTGSEERAMSRPFLTESPGAIQYLETGRGPAFPYALDRPLAARFCL
jgi:hypothetical protein